MANELQVTASMAYAKNNVASFTRAVTGQNVSVTGNTEQYGVLTVANSDTTIPLGPVSGTLGYFWAHNLDATNNINIKVAAGGTIIAQLQPGEPCLFRLGSGITAPVAISSAGSPLMEYAILPP